VLAGGHVLGLDQCPLGLPGPIQRSHRCLAGLVALLDRPPRQWRWRSGRRWRVGDDRRFFGAGWGLGKAKAGRVQIDD
jgi:hypothetical protein